MTGTGTQAHFEERKKMAEERAAALGVDLDGTPLENLAGDFTPDLEKAANLAKAIQNKDKLIEEVVKGLDIDNKAKAINGVGLGLGDGAPQGRGPGPFGNHASMAQLTAQVADLLAPGAMLQARIELSNLTTIKNQADRANISEDEAHDNEMKRRRDFEVFARYGRKALNDYREKHGERPAYEQVMDWRTGELVNVMTTASTSAGEYVPESFANELIERVAFFGGLREAVPGQTVPFSRKMNLGVADESTALGERLAENAPITHLDVTTDEVEFEFERYASKWVDVSNTLIRDSHYDFISRVFGWMAARIWRLQNQGWTVGMEGSATIAVANREYRSLNDTTANGGLAVGYKAPNSDQQVTSIKYPSLPNLVHSVDPIHRTREARLMFNDNTLGKFATMVDTTGRPLWVPSMREGEPDRLFGIPYGINSNMPDMAANAKSIAYGSFAGVQLIDVIGSMRFMRLDSEEAYVGKNMTGFALDMYSAFHPDGESNAVKFFQNAAS